MNPMDVSPYVTRIRHNHGTRVRVFVNDVPMYDERQMNFVTPTFPATPWLIPGENEIDIEIEDAPLNPDMEPVPRHFHLFMFLQGQPIEIETPLYEKEYPNFLVELPENERKLPCRYSDKFTPEGNIPEPIWADSRPEPIPEQGTPELLKALFDLYQAFSRKDLDALIASSALKLQDLQRYVGPQPWCSEAGVKKDHVEMMEQPWELAPFDPDKIRFRSCAHGRVAYATYRDGGPALFAKHKFARQAWAVRPLLVRKGADWQIYR